MAAACKCTNTGKDKIKMRKPLVEKIRRDRINKCIDQLKVLLKTEVKPRQKFSKLEKADVLEMAVVYLKNCTWPQASSPRADAHAQSYADGFACLKPTVRFLSIHEKVALEHFHNKHSLKSTDSCQRVPENTEDLLWRPW